MKRNQIKEIGRQWRKEEETRRHYIKKVSGRLDGQIKTFIRGRDFPGNEKGPEDGNMKVGKN